MIDPHAILGTSPTDDFDTIRTAWRRQIKAHHPDRFPGATRPVIEAASDMTKLINRAYQSLKSAAETPTRRSQPVNTVADAATLTRQASVLVDFADAKIRRWRDGFALIRNRRATISDALQLLNQTQSGLPLLFGGISHQLALLKKVGAASLETLCLNAARTHLSRMEAFIDGSLTQSVNQRATHNRFDAIEFLAAREAKINQLYTSFASNKTRWAEEVAGHIRRKLADTESNRRHIGRSIKDLQSAVQRSRRSHREIVAEARLLPDYVSAARGAVDRAQLMAAVALGLSRIELKAARGAKAIWRAENVVNEAKQVVEHVSVLHQEQMRAESALAGFSAKIEEVKSTATSVRTGFEHFIETVEADEPSSERAAPDPKIIAADCLRTAEDELQSITGTAQRLMREFRRNNSRKNRRNK